MTAILHINSERTWRGGERQLLLLANAQRALGHDVRIIVQPRSALQRELAKEQHALDCVTMRGEWDIAAACLVADIVRRNPVDVVHCHTSHSHFLAVLALRRQKIPLIVHRRVDFPLRTSPWNRWKYRQVDHFIAISKACAEPLAALGVTPRRISIVPSAVIPPERTTPTAREILRIDQGFRPDHCVLGTVAHFAPHKGLDRTLHAMKRLHNIVPNLRLVLVGDGPMRRPLEHLAVQLGIGDKTHFIGFRENASQYIDLFDIFIATSYLEGLNTSVMDALHLERPVIVSQAGGLPDLVAPDCGWRVDADSIETISQAVLEILADPTEARRRASNGRRHVLENFDLSTMVVRTMQVYEKLTPIFLPPF